MQYRITHTTRYVYPTPVHASLNEVRLKPRNTPHQRLLQFQLDMQPRARYSAEYVDGFGNFASVLGLEQGHLEWTVTATSEILCIPGGRDVPEALQRPVEVAQELASMPDAAPTTMLSSSSSSLPPSSLSAAASLSPGSLAEARAWLRQQHTPPAIAARCLTEASPLLPWYADLPERLGLRIQPEQMTVADLGQQLSRFIFTHFAYCPGQTEISTPLLDVVEKKAGVCQDFAHLAIAYARLLGIPARYISGYLETQPPPGVEKLLGVDATHAWFALYDPWLGWLEFDPTNDTQPDTRYITLAWGRDYNDVTPIRGVVRGGGEGHALMVSVDVQRLEEPVLPLGRAVS
jgi:transglutaminase-like putative cysteine protease